MERSAHDWQNILVFGLFFGLFWLSGVASASRLVSEGLILGLA